MGSILDDGYIWFNGISGYKDEIAQEILNILIDNFCIVISSVNIFWLRFIAHQTIFGTSYETSIVLSPQFAS